MADNDIKKEDQELEDDLTPEDEAIAPEDDKALSENADQNDNKDTQGVSQNQTQTAQNQAQAQTSPTQEQTQQGQVQQNGMTQGQQGQSNLMNSYLNMLGTIPKDQNVLQRGAEAMAFADDSHNGRIDPKTMASMFADKGTLGKIGTIFGLMLSGAGSGLAHQPNALLDMMNKELDRDLDAQKTNQTNKLNWYNAAVHHEYTNAQNDLTKANTVQALGHAALTGQELSRKIFENKQLKGYVEDNGSTQARNYMKAFIPSMLQSIVDRNGQGPLKSQAQQMLDTQVAPYFANKIHQANIDQSNKNDLFHKTNATPVVNPPTNQQGSNNAPTVGSTQDLIENPVDNEKLNNALQIGSLDIKGVPSAISPSEKRTVLDDVQTMKNIRRVAGTHAALMQFLDGLKNEGQVPLAGAMSKSAQALITGLSSIYGGTPGAIGGAVIGSLAGKAGETFEQYFERVRNAGLAKLNSMLDAAKMSPEERKTLTTTLMSQWYDSPENKRSLFENAQDVFKNKEHTLGSNLEQYGWVKPFPTFNYNPMNNKAPVEPKKEQKKPEAPSFLDMVQGGVQPDDF